MEFNVIGSGSGGIQFLDELPTAAKEYVPAADNTNFISKERCSVAVITDADSGRVSSHVESAANAGNKYGYAVLDTTAFTDGADTLVIDMEYNMSKSRWYIGIGDMSKRPGTSNKSSYDKTGLAMYHGTKDGNNYYINDTNTWETEPLGIWVKMHTVIDVKHHTVEYELTNLETGAVIYSGKEAFADKTLKTISGIELYTWTQTEMDVGTVTITATHGAKENVLYAVGSNDSYSLYAYKDGVPQQITANILSAAELENIMNSIAELETTAAAETAARTSADEALRSSTNTNTTAIATETTERKAAINEVKGLISNVSTTMETKTNTLESILSLQRDGKVYGVKFPVHTYSSTPTGTRTGAAEGLTAKPSTNTAAAENDFDNIPLFHNVMVNGYLDTSGDFIETAVEGDMRFARDGSNGDVYSRFPLSYFRYVYSDDGNYEEWQVTDTYRANQGWCPFGVFVKPDGTLRRYAYIAAYEMGYNSDGLCASISGIPVAHNTYINRNSATAGLSHNTQLTEFKKKGAQYCGMTTKEIAFLQMLFSVEFATKNSQSIMQGVTNFNYQKAPSVAETGVERIIVSNANTAYYPVGCSISLSSSGISGTPDRNTATTHGTVNRKRVISHEAYDENNTALNIDNGGTKFNTATNMIVSTMPWSTGMTDGVLGSSGSYNSNGGGYYPMMYRGIENLYGNVWTIMSDVIVSNYIPYICYDSNLYKTSVSSDYEQIGYSIATTSNQYVKELGYDANHPSVRLATVVGGSSTTYYCDYHYTTSGTNHELLFGGTVNNSSAAGLWSWGSSYAVSGAAWSFAARLSVGGRSGKRLAD